MKQLCTSITSGIQLKSKLFMIENFPKKADIIEAHKRIEKFINKTPLLKSSTINSITKTDLFFKCENFQKVGAFKMRGASNALLSLDSEQIEKGVATHSSGNHAAALSLAAKLKNIPAYIVMPKTAPSIKKEAVSEYNGIITFCEPSQAEREVTLTKIVEKTGAAFIHPYDNYKIIEGQATCAKEVFDELENIDYLVAPIGGGGLISGTCLAAQYFSTHTKVIGVEPTGADDAFRSLRDNKIYPSVKPKTIADGLLTSFSNRTFNIAKKYVDRVLLVNDSEIIDAMRLIYERMKIVVEPSAAVTLAAVIKNPECFSNKRVCCILSGGNVDLNNLHW
jgi:threonine dehydratase